MTVALLSIGTELTRGEIVDTNAAHMAAALTEAGFEVAGASSVDDDDERAPISYGPSTYAPISRDVRDDDADT